MCNMLQIFTLASPGNTPIGCGLQLMESRLFEFISLNACFIQYTVVGFALHTSELLSLKINHIRKISKIPHGYAECQLSRRFGPLPGGPWPEPTQSAMVLPLAQAGQERPAGFLIAGISPRRVLSDDYRGFLGLAAGQVATALAKPIPRIRWPLASGSAWRQPIVTACACLSWSIHCWTSPGSRPAAFRPFISPPTCRR